MARPAWTFEEHACQHCHQRSALYSCGSCERDFCHFCMGGVNPEERGKQSIVCPFCGAATPRPSALIYYPKCSACRGRTSRYSHGTGCGYVSLCKDCDELERVEGCPYRCHYTHLCDECVDKEEGISPATFRKRVIARRCPKCGRTLAG